MQELRTRRGAPVLDRTRGTPQSSVRVEWKPAYEFLLSLSAFCSEDMHPTFDGGPEPFEEIRRVVSPELTAALARFGVAGPKSWGTLVGFAWQAGDVREPAELIDRIDATAALELELALVGSHWPGLRTAVATEVFQRAALGDETAQAEVLDAIVRFESADEPVREELAAVFAMGPDAVKEGMLEILRRWYEEVYRTREAEVVPVLRADVAAKRRLATATTSERLIELATHGLEYRPQPWVDHVVLVPHLAMRPWNVMNSWDDTIIICYPADDEAEAVDELAPPPRLVRVHKALGDDKRLRMLKVLARGTATLQELADAVGLAKSTAHHHTVILRSAGLITVTLEDNSRYTLRSEAVPEVSGWLRTFLEGGHAT